MTDAEDSIIRKHLIEEESIRTKPYRDTVGKLTVGVGHNLDSGVKIPDEIIQEVLRKGEWPQSAVNMLFEYDYAVALKAAQMYVSEKVWESLSANRKVVILSMAFNMGYVNLCKFTKFLGALQKGDFKKAAAELLNSKAAQQLPKRYKRMADMIEKG